MNKFEKLASQLALVEKGLDVAQSLRRIRKASWTGTVGVEMKVNDKTHSWKDLRLCCHDLRPVFLNNDKLSYTNFSGLLGPIRNVNNKALRRAGKGMLERMALLQNEKQPLVLEHVSFKRIDEHSQLVEYSRPGYIHSPTRLATAYIFGQWSHGTRAADLYLMSQKFGKDSAFEGLTNFCHIAGHGLLIVLLAFAYEKQKLSFLEVDPSAFLTVNVPVVARHLTKIRALLLCEIAKLAESKPDLVHVRPF